MQRSYLLVAFAVLLLASVSLAENSSLNQIREEVVQRIQAANVTLPSAKGHLGKNLQSYRTIDPYLLADLMTALLMIYSNIFYNYPNFVFYDYADLELLGVRYVPQRIELNYVKRV